MKKINIFGKKVSILAILAVLLIIGTASAAVLSHYATLTGTATVTTPVVITDGNGINVVLGNTGGLNFDSDTGSFLVTNNGNEVLYIELVGTVNQLVGENAVGNIVYSGTGNGGMDGNVLTVDPNGGNMEVTVTISTGAIVLNEQYTVAVVLDTYTPPPLP